MTQRLEEAFRAVSQLPPADQDALAELLLAEVESEAEWDRRFAATADRLVELADEAHAEYAQGRAEHRCDPGSAVSWEKVRAELLGAHVPAVWPRQPGAVRRSTPHPRRR